MNTGIKIINCDPEDIPEVVAISRRLSKDGLVNELTVDALKNYNENYYVIAAKSGKKVVGFAVSSYSWGKLHIEEVGVKKELQGKGIGKKIIEHLITHSKGKKLPEVYCEIKAKNVASLKLFFRLGFKERLFCSFVDEPFYGLYLSIV